ncbi:MAG: phenylalanine--tRNA ligase subunit beta [Alicyclobacillaceae bacterium]|nr:phenylalanine--tRNA ligase subunit beta [Alicyclobacillaceae bacterium]
MRLSYQWLAELVDLDGITPADLAEGLTKAGIEVEAVAPRSPRLSGVVVGLVKAVEPHPNADRLRVCQVDAGGGELLTIVCGAPNVAPGQKVPTALVGAELPGGAIGKARLRGVESHGMLCSAKEIGLETRLLPKEQTEGLYVLPADAPVGADVARLLALDDVVLELSLTPNRSDCLSMRGLAYEVGAIFGRPVRFPECADGSGASGVLGTGGPAAAAGAAEVRPGVAAGAVPARSPVTVRIETPNCSRYEAQVVGGLVPGPSPLWLQMRLLAMGVRPINNIVDVTNYVMLEWGQPLHAFDFDQVRQGTIVVRQAAEGEVLVTLDGERRELTADMMVIADPERAIGLAGVMGGENSEVTGRTRRIVIESASFDAGNIRRTGQRLGLRSEAQQRFEKGIDPVAVHGALVRAVALLREIAGAVPEGGIVSVGDPLPAPRLVAFSPARCNRALGTAIAESEMRAVFERLGFEVIGTADGGRVAAVSSDGSPAPTAAVEGSGGEWTVRVPSRRMDVAIEADLVEEVARLAGYEHIPSTLPVGPSAPGLRSPRQRLHRRTREVLSGAGMSEVVTYTFRRAEELDALRLPADSPLRRAIPLLRPMSEDRAVIRTHLLPGLAEVARYNLAHEVAGGQVFELGRVFLADPARPAAPPREVTRWAGLWFGHTEPSLGERPRRYDFYDAKGVIEVWLEALGSPEAAFVRTSEPWFHPGRSAQVQVGGRVIGSLGELHPETASALDLLGAVYADFDLDAVAELVADGLWTEELRVRRLPRHPSSRRDLAAIVPRDVPAAALIQEAQAAVRAAKPEWTVECRVFDVYQGAGIPAGHVSVAISFVYRGPDRTLTDEEVSDAEQAVIRRWQERLGVRLRAGF